MWLKIVLAIIFAYLVPCVSMATAGQELFLKKIKLDLKKNPKVIYTVCFKRINVEIRSLSKDNDFFLKNLLDLCLSENVLRFSDKQENLQKAVVGVLLKMNECAFPNCAQIFEKITPYFFSKMEESKIKDIVEDLRSKYGSIKWDILGVTEKKIIIKNISKFSFFLAQQGYFEEVKNIYDDMIKNNDLSIPEMQDFLSIVSEIYFAYDSPDKVEKAIGSIQKNVELIPPLQIQLYSSQIIQRKMSEAENMWFKINEPLRSNPIKAYYGWLLLEQVDFYIRRSEYKKAEEILANSEAIYKESLPDFLLLIATKKSILLRMAGKIDEALSLLSNLKNDKNKQGVLYIVDYYMELSFLYMMKKDNLGFQRVKKSMLSLIKDKPFRFLIEDRVSLLEAGLLFLMTSTADSKKELLSLIQKNSKKSFSKKKDIIDYLMSIPGLKEQG